MLSIVDCEVHKLNFSGTKCDCCGRVKGEGNHWIKIGVLKDSGRVNIELGYLFGPRIGADKFYEVHDLCGEACFHKQIGKLLKINQIPDAPVGVAISRFE